MARTVTHPKKGFTGRVVGVDFVDGVAEVVGKARLFWFQRHGYKIAGARDSKAPKAMAVKSPAADADKADSAPPTT